MNENLENVETVNCSSCKAEIPTGMKFCTSCGKPVGEDNSSRENSQNICPKCFTELDSSLSFCTKCGTKITRTVSSDVVTSCPKCYADVEPGLKFCTECGTKITRTVSSDVVTSCPKCYADVEPGLKFCTECGTSLDIPDTSSSNINEKLRQRRAADGKDVPSEDDTIDNIVESGKGLMKGLGGFLNKTAESFDKKVDNSRQKQVIARKPKATDNNTNPGYLVCNSCGGYYQLEQGESPDDFEDVCDCGGKFMHKTEL